MCGWQNRCYYPWSVSVTSSRVSLAGICERLVEVTRWEVALDRSPEVIWHRLEIAFDSLAAALTLLKLVLDFPSSCVDFLLSLTHPQTSSRVRNLPLCSVISSFPRFLRSARTDAGIYSNCQSSVPAAPPLVEKSPHKRKRPESPSSTDLEGARTTCFR